MCVAVSESLETADLDGVQIDYSFEYIENKIVYLDWLKKVDIFNRQLVLGIESKPIPASMDRYNDNEKFFAINYE